MAVSGIDVSGDGVITSELAEAPVIHQLTASPRLSQRTQEEVVAENDASSREDPDNYPLHSSWTFWFDRSQRGANPGDFFANLRRLATVTSIKAFWSVFNNLPTCDKLHDRDSYHLMRSNCRRPVWEDADNVDGGMWIIKLGKRHTVVTWQELLLAAVGEQLSTSVHCEDEICGISVRIRHDGDIIQIWNQDSELEPKATVLERVKELVPMLEIRSAFYQSNKAKMRDSLSKPIGGGHHRGLSPIPPSFTNQRRYSGAPPSLFPPFHPLPSKHHRPLFGTPHPLPNTFHTPPHFRPSQSFSQQQHIPHPPPHSHS